MSREQTNLLGLSSPPARSSPPASPYLAPRGNPRLTKEQKQSIQDFDSAMLAIQGKAILGAEAIRRTAQIHRYGFTEFVDTVRFMLDTIDQCDGEELRLYATEFFRVDVKVLASDLKAIIETVDEDILKEARTPLHVERDTRGPLKKLFG